MHPGYQLFVGGGLPGFVRRDVALVQLSEPVPTSVVARYAVLPQAGVVDGLANKTAVDLVGYGASVRSTGGSRPVWDGWSGRASTDDG